MFLIEQNTHLFLSEVLNKWQRRVRPGAALGDNRHRTAGAPLAGGSALCPLYPSPSQHRPQFPVMGPTPGEHLLCRLGTPCR